MFCLRKCQLLTRSLRYSRDSNRLTLTPGSMAPTKRESPAQGQSTKKPKLITEFFANVPKKNSQKPKVKIEKETKVIEIVNRSKPSKEQSNEILPATVTETKSSDIMSTKPSPLETSDSSLPNYDDFCERMNFNKDQWVATLSEEEKRLLALEINTLHITWLACLHKEIVKPYFLKLKQFLRSQMGKTVFPPPGKIYSWSHLTPVPEVKCLILGQDPYHNFNQAHGLAFLVLEPTRPPPSLVNIYKALKIDFPTFEIPDYDKLNKAGTPGGGNLTKWSKRGVLMLNACLTVEAHKANSHAKQGWEPFTEQVIKTAIVYAKEQNQSGFVIMAWGTPAQKRVAVFSNLLLDPSVPFTVLRTVHPSPLSASRGFFDLHVFKNCNEWLRSQGKDPVDWGIMDGNSVT